jgi:hypothetical protein
VVPIWNAELKTKRYGPMPSYPKVVLQVAAMAGIAVMLTMAVPAVAAEGPIAPRESASAASP